MGKGDVSPSLPCVALSPLEPPEAERMPSRKAGQEWRGGRRKRREGGVGRGGRGEGGMIVENGREGGMIYPGANSFRAMVGRGLAPPSLPCPSSSLEPPLWTMGDRSAKGAFSWKWGILWIWTRGAE